MSEKKNHLVDGEKEKSTEKQESMDISTELVGDLLDNIRNAVIVVDQHDKMVYVNVRTEEIFRAEAEELHGQPIHHLFMPEDEDILVDNILSLTRREGEFEVEAMLKRLDGNGFLGMIATSLFSCEEKRKAIAITIHDLTEIKAVENSLRQSERLAYLGHLIDDLSHQIRNPLTAIGGFARRLSTETDSSPKVEAILDEAMRLENLLDRMNDFIALRCPVITSTEIGGFIDLVDQKLSTAVKAHGCQWRNDYDGSLNHQCMLVDGSLLLEALTEVAINCCESYDEADEDKSVIIRAGQSDDPSCPYVIKIIDHGRGIIHEHINFVFSHFYSNKTKHVGIGLALAKRIVEEQGGGLTLSSTLGEGTVVDCYLPKERRRLVRTTKF